MPLIQGKSKKAFSENVSKEMDAGKPQKQSLAIAYSIKRKNERKKMASGGSVDITAPEEKEAKADTSTPEETRMVKGSPTGQGAIQRMFTTEPRSNIDNSVTPEEMEMIRQHRVKMSSGGPVEIDFVSEGRTSIDDANTPEEMAMRKGKKNDPAGVEDEYGERESPEEVVDDTNPDNRMRKYAKGGSVKDPTQEHLLPGDKIPNKIEGEVVHNAKNRMRRYMAEGGQVDLEENAEEHENTEDDLSWDALRKENYSEQSALDDLTGPEDSNEHSDDVDSDEHDMISKIRSKIRTKRGM